MRAPQKFRVYPEARGLYLVVRVFETKKQMFAYYKRANRGLKRVGLNFEAIVSSKHVISFKKGPIGRSLPKVADVLFVRKNMTMNIVTHESGHAALAWFRRKFRGHVADENMGMEERFCYALGHIGREIVGRTKGGVNAAS